ncbi:MAG: MarR family winged helix-turn-helix transcriptional regulator [Acidobacteriaceae bacterium]
MIPASLSASCACSNIRRANRAISHLYDQVLVPTRLKSTQFMVLRAIAEAGEIAHCDLAAELMASVETLSRRLAGARRAGLVQVHGGQHNKRMYSLTAKGRCALEEAIPYWQNAQMRLRRSLGSNDWKLLDSFTQRLAVAAIRAESLPLSNGHCEAPAPSRPRERAEPRLL